jgi:hypothetical protein
MGKAVLQPSPPAVEASPPVPAPPSPPVASVLVPLERLTAPRTPRNGSDFTDLTRHGIDEPLPKSCVVALYAILFWAVLAFL